MKNEELIGQGNKETKQRLAKPVFEDPGPSPA
jgi:hypothetical protein